MSFPIRMSTGCSSVSLTGSTILRFLNSVGRFVACVLFESGGQMLGVTRAVIVSFSFSVFKESETTSYALLVLSVVPNVFMWSVSLFMGWSFSFLFSCCVTNVFCDLVSMSMHAVETTAFGSALLLIVS